MLVPLCSVLCYPGGVSGCTGRSTYVGAGQRRDGTSGDLLGYIMTSLSLETVPGIYNDWVPVHLADTT